MGTSKNVEKIEMITFWEGLAALGEEALSDLQTDLATHRREVSEKVVVDLAVLALIQTWLYFCSGGD